PAGCPRRRARRAASSSRSPRRARRARPRGAGTRAGRRAAAASAGGRAGPCAAAGAPSCEEIGERLALVFRDRPVEDDAPVAERDDAVGVPLELLDILGREGDGAARVAERLDPLPEPPPLTRIQRRRRL